MGSYCDLETTELPSEIDGDVISITTEDGGLMSMIKVNGNVEMVGATEQELLNKRLYKAIDPLFNTDGHFCTWSFELNSDLAKRHIHSALVASYNTVKRLHLDIADVIQDDEERLLKFTSYETCLLTLWTSPNAIPAQTLKNDIKEKVAFMAENKIGSFAHAQSPFVGYRSLLSRHEASVKSLVHDLSRAKLLCEVLTAKEALRQTRQAIQPQHTHFGWTPKLPGSRINPLSEVVAGDLSHVYYPRLQNQLITQKQKVLRARNGTENILIGTKINATLLFDIYPETPTPFSHLLATIDDGVPFRINFMFEPRGLNKMKTAKTILSIIGFVGENRIIKDAFKNLFDLERGLHPAFAYAKKKKHAVTRLRIGVTTWAEDEKKLESNVALISRAVQGWGGCDVTVDSGDPFGSLISTIPGFSRRNLATPVCAPLFDVIKMLPTTRPASPWEKGSILFRTPDGKLFPMQPGSSMQDAWIDLIFAPMGSGKSVLVNLLGYGLVTSPGHKKLPYYAIIDVGPSSKGLISLIKEGLPDDRKHEAGYFLLQNDKAHSINPWDTQLGCRRPTEFDRSFQVNLLTLLATEAGKESVGIINDLASHVIDLAYTKFSDTKSPKLYEAEVETMVDTALKGVGYEVQELTTWWEVVDFLYSEGDLHSASRAQVHAVPTLQDFPEILQDQTIQDIFGNAEMPTKETPIKYLSRVISSSVREYKLLAGPTQFDIGMCRVLSLDLNEVARGGGSAEGAKRVSIMYMLAGNITTRNYFIGPDNVAEILNSSPEQYHAYHKKRAKEIKGTQKQLAMDEVHRAGGKAKSSAFLDFVLQMAREGRKFNVIISLASQLLGDFPPELVELAQSIYILKADSYKNIPKIAKEFGLNAETTSYLANECTGPSSEGAPFVGVFKTKKGVFMQGLVNTVGARKLWAFGTVNEDQIVRNYLYDKIGPKNARSFLAKRFPGGGCKSEVEKFKLQQDGKIGTEDVDEIDTIMSEMYAKKLYKESLETVF